MERRMLSSIPMLLFCLGIAQAEDLAALDSQHTSDRSGPAQSDAPFPELVERRPRLAAPQLADSC